MVRRCERFLVFRIHLVENSRNNNTSCFLGLARVQRLILSPLITPPPPPSPYFSFRSSGRILGI